MGVGLRGGGGEARRGASVPPGHGLRLVSCAAPTNLCCKSTVRPRNECPGESCRIGQMDEPRRLPGLGREASCRFERIEGRVVVMAPERVGHARLKGRMYRALSAAVEVARLPCEVLVDGPTI